MDDSFGEWLKGARGAAGLSQSELDAVLIRQADKRTGYTAQLENGRVKAPDRDVCNAIAQALGLEEDGVWRVSAHERMKLAKVLSFHQQELERAKPSGKAPKLTEPERHLLEQLRELPDGVGGMLRFLEALRAMKSSARTATPEGNRAHQEMPSRDGVQQWLKTFEGPLVETSMLLMLMLETWRTVGLFPPTERLEVLQDMVRAQWGIRTQRLADKDETIARKLEALELQMERPAQGAGSGVHL